MKAREFADLGIDSLILFRHCSARKDCDHGQLRIRDLGRPRERRLREAAVFRCVPLCSESNWHWNCSATGRMSWILGSCWYLTKIVFSQWNKHEAPGMGAALAFYTILSLSPLLLLTVAIAGIFLNRSEVSRQLARRCKTCWDSPGRRLSVAPRSKCVPRSRSSEGVLCLLGRTCPL
jgi:hypothetical protein